MRVIIAGSRSITNIKYVIDAIEFCKSTKNIDITEVVSGAARGVDKLGEKWARENNIKISSHPADWNTYKKAAGYIRNKEMGEYADFLIAVWDGNSNGTRHMINIMKKLNKPYYIHYVYIKTVE